MSELIGHITEGEYIEKPVVDESRMIVMDSYSTLDNDVLTNKQMHKEPKRPRSQRVPPMRRGNSKAPWKGCK